MKRDFEHRMVALMSLSVAELEGLGAARIRAFLETGECTFGWMLNPRREPVLRREVIVPYPVANVRRERPRGFYATIGLAMLLPCLLDIIARFCS